MSVTASRLGSAPLTLDWSNFVSMPAGAGTAAAAHLAEDHVLLAVVAEVASHHAAAVAVHVGPGQEADVQEVAPAARPADVEEGPLALVGAQVVALHDDVPGVLGPPLVELLIQLARYGHFGPTIVRL